MKENRNHKIHPPLGKEPLRLIALSDGLFATVLTLLVLDLRIPDAVSASSGNPLVFIKWIGPHLFSYLLTFLVAGTYWLGHHRDFDNVVQFDRGLLGYNLLFLLFIGLLPFSTATISLGEFKAGAFPFYWAIYAANIILAGIMLNLTWNYAVSHHLIAPETTRQQCRRITIRQFVTPAVFLLSVILEYFFPQLFLAPYTLLLIPLAQRRVDRYYAEDEPNKPSGNARWQELLWRAGTMLIWIVVIGLAIWAIAL